RGDGPPVGRGRDLVGACQRFNSPAEGGNEVGQGGVAIERLGQNRIDGGQYILDTMIELGDQHPLLVLGPPSLRYVDIDTEQAQRAAVGLEGNEAARLDPPDLALAAKKAIIDGILAEALLKR